MNRVNHIDFKRDTIQGVTPAKTAWGKHYAAMEHARVGLARVFAIHIPVKEMWACLNCGSHYIENNNPMFCSERCEVLTDQALDEIRGK